MSGYAAFYEFYRFYLRQYPDQRPGQGAFNAASMFSPQTQALAVAINGTSLDPFYHDHRLMNFLEYIRLGLEAEGDLVASLADSAIKLTRIELLIKHLNRRLFTDKTLTEPERGAYRYIIENILKIIEGEAMAEEKDRELNEGDKKAIQDAAKKAVKKEKTKEDKAKEN